MPDDLRYFLAIARSRSLSLAAKELGVSPPTVSRRLTAIEKGLGVSLFDRTTAGYKPSDAGIQILETAEHVEEQIDDIGRKLFGRDRELRVPPHYLHRVHGQSVSVATARRVRRTASGHRHRTGVHVSALELESRRGRYRDPHHQPTAAKADGRKVAKAAFDVYRAAMRSASGPHREDLNECYWIDERRRHGR